MSFNTMRERREKCVGRYAYVLEGAILTLVELLKCDADEAKRIIADFEAQDRTIKDLYRYILDLAGDRRLIVEKSTVYGHDPATLRRIEEDFENPLYIHLVRHPCAVIRSFQEAHTDRVLRFDAPFPPRQLGELEWTLQQRNILSFLEGIPEDRRLRVTFEELVRDPASILSDVCSFLGVEEHPDMTDPYRNESKRMTGGLHQQSRVLGDYKFAQHGKLDPTVATRWKGEIDPASLGEPTLVLARELGYPDVPPAESVHSKPLSLQQQRLWFLDQAGVGVAYNVVSCARLDGRIDVERFERSLRRVVERHHVLRSVFRFEDGEPRQVVEPGVAKAWRVEDLRGVPEADREGRARRLVDEEAERPFDLERGPVFRATLIRVHDDEWIFVLVVHHIVFDAHSTEVLFRELGEHYRSLSEADAAGMAPLPLQYGEFAEAQRQLLTEEALQRQLSYWRECLGGGIEPIELPLDHPRPARQTYAGGSVPLSVDGALAAQLKRRANAHDATQAMLLMTTWITLLARYSGQTDIAVGLGVVNRTSREIRDLIGFFVNTIVLRTDLADDPTFAELLARVRTSFVHALDNQDIPFERVVQELQPVRDPGRNPIFQVFFAANEFSAPPLELPGVRVSRFDRDYLAVHFDLELQIGDDGDGLSGCLLYNSNLFERTTVERMRDHYLNLLDAVAKESTVAVSTLPMLDVAETRSVLLLNNDTSADYRRDRCVHQLVAEQAARTPASTAVRDLQESWTYAELVEKSERLARRLRSRGARPGVLVGLAVGRGCHMVEALLGILGSGAAYVPLDVGHPPDRLRHMLADSGAGLLVTDKASVSGFGDFSGDIIIIGDGASETDVRVEADAPTARPADLAYVIYTSGSTGKPKGVEVTHRNLVNFLESMSQAPGFAAQDVLLAVTTLSFDIAALELFLPLVAGGTVVIAPHDAVSDGERLQALLDQHSVTVMQGTPATWQLLLHSGWEGKPGLKMLCGGEALPRQLADALLQRGGELWNMYGPTETTVWSSILRVEPEDDAGAGPIPIGRPIANTFLYVLDRHARPVPRGVVGELWIAGDGVARGYLNRAELTAERFLADPFRDEPGARMYRTGDLARYDSRGRLLFLGRIDHQIKLRGFRIELGEIESALMACPGVVQAAVILHDDGANDPRLIAYTVGDPAATPDALSRQLATSLPAYMLPTRFIRLEAMPLSSSGKIDRRALPVPERGRTAETAVVAPRTETERAIADIWGEVLRSTNVGVHDDFFRLGGHSLIATQVLSRITREFDVRMPLSAFFRTPTVAGMAEWVDHSRRTGGSALAATMDGSARVEGEI
jgi:amino acid adenylation domain-containing protein